MDESSSSSSSSVNLNKLQPNTAATRSPAKSTQQSSVEANNNSKRKSPEAPKRNYQATSHRVQGGGGGGGGGGSLRKRSRALTVCLLCFVAAISSIAPYLGQHLTNQLGLLLFEADLVQLRASQFSCAICFVFFALFASLLLMLISPPSSCDNNNNNPPREDTLLRTTKILLPLAAIVSSLAYLSIVLLVPHIKQVQRLPLATFNCDANLITIENCHQSYTGRGSQALRYILFGLSEEDDDNYNYKDQVDDGDRLIRDLNCLRYNDGNLKSVQVPTNFLLHSCGLICRPQRQHYHQFNDDLNSLNETTRDNTQQQQSQQQQHSMGQVSLKVCFSDELGGSNYKQYCITNLADSSQQQQQQQQQRKQDKTLTLGQLNALLRRSTTAIISRQSESSKLEEDFLEATLSEGTASPMAPIGPVGVGLTDKNDDQATHYMNPIVQFESHFKNWPYLSNSQHEDFDQLSGTTNIKPAIRDQRHEDGWCQFRPIPPFIVNNKPFSDIKCSIEHEYTMTTGGSTQAAQDRIYLKKSSSDTTETLDSRNERCSIQCKVNILYQVRLEHSNTDSNSNSNSNSNQKKKKGTVKQHYYLPMKSCNMISGESMNKAAIIRQCVIFRTIGDTALTICLLLLDLLLLMESIETKQFYLEQNKTRFLGLLITVLLVPLLMALQFDLIQLDDKSGYLSTFFNDTLRQYLHQLSQRFGSKSAAETLESSKQTISSSNSKPAFHFDSYLLPVFNFTIIAFILTISSRDLNTSNRPVSLVRISSTEELGLAGRRSVSPGSASKSKLAANNFAAHTATTTKQRLEVAMLFLVSLILGTQFYLSLSLQTLIIRETFANKKYSSSWFEVNTRTGPILLMSLLAFVFRNEISAYLGNFCPFSRSANIDELTNNKNRSKFLKYVSLSLAIYALRFALLSALNKESPIKYPIVFLFFLSELFNFPLVWFSLCRRAHELLMQQQYTNYAANQATDKSSASQADRAVKLHLVVQVGLAFIYFVLARLVALSLHSLSVGLHLHSDDIDWFITGFQRQLEQKHQQQQRQQFSASTIRQSTDNNSSTISGGADISGDTSSSADDGHTEHNNGLFSPLPSERQTYLHASRLFLKYNSLLCLLVATLMAANFLYVKYQLWSDQRRTFHLSAGQQQQHHGDGDDDDDEMSEFNQQLSLDLQQVRRESSSTRPPPQTSKLLIYPSDISNRSETSTSRADTPRAKVLFHYQLDRIDKSQRHSSSASSSSSSSIAPPSAATAAPAARRELASPEVQQSPIVRVISVDRDEEYSPSISLTPRGDHNGQRRPEVEREVESTTNYRNKSVRILEQEPQDIPIPDSWANNNNNNYRHQRDDIRVESPTRERKRTISFAPEATFIGGGADRAAQRTVGGQRSKSYVSRVTRTSTTTRTIRTASPEPSIDDEQSGSSDS